MDSPPLDVPTARTCPITATPCDRGCPTHGVWPFVFFAPCVRISEGLHP